MTSSPIKPTQQKERRTEVRNDVSEIVVVKTSKAGTSLSQLLNVSTSGLRATSPVPLALDTRIEILVDGAKLVGSIRNCVRAAPSQFHVGVGNVTSTRVQARELPIRSSEAEPSIDALR